MENKRFKCLAGCGRCCTGGGFIYVSEEDIVRLERHTGLGRDKFVSKGHFTDTRHGDRELSYLNKNNLSCVFLDGTTCGVYEGRPTQCRSFPFWPENLNPETWKTLKKYYCPGIDEGDVVPEEEAQKQLDSQIDSDLSIKNSLVPSDKLRND